MQVISVDIGGTWIKSAVVSRGKIVSKVHMQKTHARKGKKSVLKNIISSIKVFEDYLKKRKAKAVGIGCPGPLDYRTGIIKASVNIPLKGVNLAKYVKNRFKKYKVKVFLDNDANCFVLAEALYGAGKNYSNVAGFTLGTGIGGGIIHNKKIFHGMRDAGELGHIKIEAVDGRRCHCKKTGCVEAYASADGIVKTAKEHKLKVKNPKELYEIAKGIKKASKKQKNKTKKVFEETGTYFGMAISNLVAVEHPEIVVVGGRISKSWEFMHKAVQKAAKKYSITEKIPKITKAKLRKPGIIGAAALAERLCPE